MKRKNLKVAVALAIAVAVASVALAGPAAKSTAPVLDFASFATFGTSKLVRTDSGISYNFRTIGTGIFRGATFTLWVVVFNNPDGCLDAADDGFEDGCGLGDILDAFGGSSPSDVDVLYGGGNVAGNSGSVRFGGHRQAGGDNSGSFYTELGADYDPPGLYDPRGAEVHFVMRGHGPKVPANMPAQIQSFLGGCEGPDEIPPAIADEEGECMECHDPHKSEHGGLVKLAGAALCYECHDEDEVLTSKPHKSMEGRSCTACHNPHGADRRALLRPEVK